MIKGPKYQRGFLGVAALIFSGLSAAKGAHEGKKASKAMKGSNEAQRRINKLRNKQAKREFLQNFRQAQAAAITGAVASGVSLESSSAQGRQSSLGTQGRLAVAEFNMMDELGGQMTRFQNQAASAQSRAQTWGAISSFASSFISFGAGPGADPGAAAGGKTGGMSMGGFNNAAKPGDTLGFLGFGGK